MKRSDQIKRQLRKRPEDQAPLYLSTGSTVLNLACTNHPQRGFRAGHYYLFVGDSDSGKTFICMTCLAEACCDPVFDQYRMIYDAPEGGALMSIEQFFGEKLARRLEPPARYEDGSPRHSLTVQEFYYHVDDALKRGPCIYLLDSQDCLSSDQEVKKFQKDKRLSRRKAGDDKEEGKGSYGDAKAKYHSANLRRLLTPLERSGSILIIINQTRDSFDLFEKSTMSGGRALKFYATLQLWSSPGGKIKQNVKGKERLLGIQAKVRVKKNRETGRDRTVLIPIYNSFGMDDVGSCVDYLVSEKVWSESNGIIIASGLGAEVSKRRDKLVQHIEENGLEGDLRDLVAETWSEIEEACKVVRKRRYE